MTPSRGQLHKKRKKEKKKKKGNHIYDTRLNGEISTALSYIQYSTSKGWWGSWHLCKLFSWPPGRWGFWENSKPIKGVDREKSAVFKELTQSFQTYELRGQAKKKKKKSSNRIKDKQVPHTLLQKLSPKSLTSPLRQAAFSWLSQQLDSKLPTPLLL